MLLNPMKLITNYLNPLSPDFIFTKLFNNISGLFSFFDPIGEDFIFSGFFKDIENILSYLNPLSDNFLGKKLVELLGDLLKTLFIPSEERITALQDTFTSKFSFVESIKIAINSFKDIINNLGNAPSLSLDLGATKYTDNMTVKVIDLNWYKPYKQYGDVVITAVFYAFYLWRFFSRLPSIISGAGSGTSDLLHISNYEEGGKK